MKKNFKEMPGNNKVNNRVNNKPIFAVLVVIAVLLAAAIGLSFSDLILPISTSPADTEYAEASLFALTGSTPTYGNQTNCTDTDGGIMPYIKGTVKYKGKSYTDFCWYNGRNVTNSSAVAEFYCGNSGTNRTIIYCPGGCYYGACKNVTIVDISPGMELYGTAPTNCAGSYIHTFGANADACTMNCRQWCTASCKGGGGPPCWGIGNCLEEEDTRGGKEYNCYCGCFGEGVPKSY